MSNAAINNDRQGKTITFYSYKGGVGRSMALVNIACLMAMRGKKTLIIDWDVEAPGLHSFFNTDKEKPGLVDLITEVAKHVKYEENNNEEGYARFFTQNLDTYIEHDVVPKKIKNGNGKKVYKEVKLDIMKAGKFGDGYSKKLEKIQWMKMYKTSPALFRTFACCLEKDYDYILIDSRTGLADAAGISTMLMPQKLVTVFALNEQNINGVADIAAQAIDYRFQSYDYRILDVYPLPARVETKELEDIDGWTSIYQTKFENIFKEKFSLSKCDLTDYFGRCIIPYYSIHAHGENIPVLYENLSSPAFISINYDRFLDVLLKNKSPWDILSLEQEAENIKKANDYFNKATELLRSNQVNADTILLLDKAINIYSESDDFYSWRGWVKNELKDFVGAIEDYSHAIRYNSYDAIFYSNRGYAKNELKDAKGALEDYNIAVKLDPSLHFAYSGRGYAKGELKNYLGAIEDYDLALKLGPEDGRIFNNRGAVKIELKDYTGALQDYDRAIILNPSLAFAYSGRGDVKNELKDFVGAIDNCNIALKLDANLEHAYGILGRAKTNLGNYKDALEDFNRAIELKSDYKEAYFDRATTYLKLQKVEDAKRDFTKALELGFEPAKAELEKLG